MKHRRITLSQMLEEVAIAASRKTAMIYFGHRIPYSTFLSHVQRVAAGLQALGLRKGDRVALLLPNCPQFFIAYFGVLRAGGIVTATSPIYTPREAIHQWNDAGATILIADALLAPLVNASRPACPQLRRVILTHGAQYTRSGAATLARALRSPKPPGMSHGDPLPWENLLRISRHPQPAGTRPDDVACLQYTGGTTGVSKGAMLTHANLVVNAEQTCEWLTGGQLHGETFVAALPLFHIYATTCVMISAVHSASATIILPRFELEPVLQAVREHRPSLFHGVPTMYVALNTAPDIRRYGFGALRVCMSGGAPLPIAVQQEFETKTGARLVEGYGLTECSPATHVNPPGAPRAGSIGQLVPGTEARIVDLDKGTTEVALGEEGELTIRGPQVMKGYWNKPEETAAVLRDGWLYTGDIAKRDSEGFYYIVDRKKDLILVGGFNVYPREVEEVLFQHPAIQEAGVVGVADAYRGESVKAFVVRKPGASLAEEEVIEYCRKNLAAYKIPRSVEFRDTLPRSGVGKYLRRELRKTG
ncbi:MAG: long-chain fatty acid--CoA ligase [Verrucomicrobia bacterium]|nr:long-chain fatty acid--CoA ligase [Verrucomicrobiota bacterium]